MPSKVYVYEFKTRQERAAAARNALNPSEATRRLDDGSSRIFRIKAYAPVGFDTVKVEAKKVRKTEATLKVVVVDKKTVKVAIRAVQVRDAKAKAFPELAGRSLALGRGSTPLASKSLTIRYLQRYRSQTNNNSNNTSLLFRSLPQSCAELF